jgi:heat shock protein HslJ
MAEEAKTKEKSKDEKKILTVIGILIIGAVILYFLSVSKYKSNYGSANNNSNTTTNQTVSQAPADSASQLTSKKWTWINTKMNDGAVTTPSKPGAFAATFQTDGRVVANTDCNTGNGGYTLGADNSLTIGPMASTMMFCEGSNEGEYFQQLGNVGSYKIDNGQLWLMLKYDSGTMIFE